MNPAGKGQLGHVQRRSIAFIHRTERGSRLLMQKEISRQHAALGTGISEVLVLNGLGVCQFEGWNSLLDGGKKGLRQLDDVRQNTD